MDTTNENIKPKNSKVNSSVQSEILGEVSKGVIFLKIISYTLLALFFGMISSLNYIVFPNNILVGEQSLKNIELIWIFVLATITLVSNFIILFTGSHFKSVWPLKYYLGIFFNNLILFILVAISTSIIKIENTNSIISRANFYLITFIVYAVTWFVIMTYFYLIGRNAFPLVETKYKFFVAWSLYVIVIAVLLRSFAVSEVRSSQNEGLIYSIIMIMLSLLMLTYIVFAFVFIKLFKSNAVVDLREVQIEKIKNSRDLLSAASLVISVAIAIVAIVIRSDSSNAAEGDSKLLLIIGIAITTTVLFFYLAMTSLKRKVVVKQNFEENFVEKKSKRQVTTSLDNMLFSTFVTFLVVIVNTILIGISESLTRTQTSSVYLLIVTGIFIFLINVYNIMAKVKMPNFKNYISSTIAMTIALVLVCVTILYSSIKDSTIIKTFLPVEMSLLLMVTLTIGFTMLLLIAVVSIFRIESFNKKKPIKNKKTNKETPQNTVETKQAQTFEGQAEKQTL
ncbi:hypothetical protein [Mycoplasmopsis pulmonis]|uniref:hypothetical protein n=1 Tax=Mycoplasmopsis pulmonis TaxID=2107 RepID=UPI0010050B4B|nr:hypothetical protein [Mycoplasmopsis pulmonis]VEU67990.1 Uncharacterised protein [Mycoplasmopsis pulmonis]